MRRFISNSAKSAMVLGAVLTIFDLIGPLVAGDYFTLIRCGIILLFLAVSAFIVRRLYVGIQSGHLLVDDVDE